MLNEMVVLPLYLAWQSLVPLNNSGTTIINVAQPPSESKIKLAMDLPSGYAIYPDEGIAYKLHRERKSWEHARRHCMEEGGNLAVVDSFTKVEYIMNLKGPIVQPDIHVGIHRYFDENQYVDVKTGSRMVSMPWLVTYSFTSDKTRKCIVIPYTGGGLVASHCDELYNFVCEISIFKG